MKKLILGLLAACSIATANAQEGTWLAYGNLGLHTGKDELKTSHFDWNVRVGIGYQFNKDWTVGLNVGFMQDSTSKTDGSSDKYTRNSYLVGPFIRYTKVINNVFSIYGQFDATYEGGYNTFGDQPSFAKHTGFVIDVFPAVALNLGNSWAMNFSIGGLYYSTDKVDGATNSSNSFGISFGQQVNIGMSKTFGCGKSHHGKKSKEKEKESDED